MNIQELIKGIVIGIAKIIPGLSGAVLMISFNLYDRAIDAITHFFSNPKKNFFFLLNLSLGIISGIVLFSKILSYFILHYYLYTTALFLGLILGGVPVIAKKIIKSRNNYLLVLLSFSFMSFIAIITPSNHYSLRGNSWDLLVFSFSGFLEAIGTILPGISSTALLMFIGVYDQYIKVLSNVLNIVLIKENLTFLIPFSCGLFLGIILLSLLVNYLFRSYSSETFSVILGISFATVLSLIIRLFPYVTGVISFGIAMFFLVIGYLFTNKLT